MSAMELKIIYPPDWRKEVIVVPTEKNGVVTGVVETDDTEGLVEKVGAGVLLSHIPAEAIQRVEENPDEKLEEFLQPVEGRNHSIKLVNGAEGLIYEALDRDLDPVRGQRLVLDGFNEYAPYGERVGMPPLRMPSDTGL